MSEWIEVGKFKAEDKSFADKEKLRVEDLAMDVALDPKKVVRLIETEQGLSLQVDSYFYEYYQGA